jgi:hypothetical protein
MTVSEIIAKLGLSVLATGTDQPVRSGYVSDLLSDVIGNAEEGCLWITVQRHLNIVAVAQLKKVAGIIIAGAADIDPEIMRKAESEKIYVLKSRENAFTLAGKLYALIQG